MLTLPCDRGTYCIGLIASARDKHLRALRHPGAWLAAASISPVAQEWATQGHPITAVMPIAGIEDVCRSYLRDGLPVVTGLVAVGDSAAATNPSLGRGATIGLLHARALRDTLAHACKDPVELVEAFGAATSAEVTPWVAASTWFDRHRLAEMEADVTGGPYATEDVGWQTSTALRVGTPHDPVLARASSMLAGMLAPASQVFSDADLQRRLAPHRGQRAYPPDGPTRAEVLHAIDEANLDCPELTLAGVVRAP